MYNERWKIATFSFFIIHSTLFILPQRAVAQTTSSISKFVTPPFISGCNNDTIKIELTNLYGAKGVTYSGPVKYSVTVPAAGTIKYIGGTVSSVPAGATSSSPTGNTVDITVPLPPLGQTTIIKFVVNADCNVLKLNPLPQFTAVATYPTPYPITGETLNSAVLSVGTAQLNVANNVGNLSQRLNKNVPFSSDFTSAFGIINGGYGSIDNIVLTATTANETAYTGNWILSSSYGNYGGVTPISTTPAPGNKTTRVYNISGSYLGPDKLLTPGELIFFVTTQVVL